ncbi:MAG: type II secretion system F family protein [Candidatus Micrarchaeia archaeon]
MAFSYENVGRVFPRGIVRLVGKNTYMAGMTHEPEWILGALLSFSLLLGALLFVVLVISTDLVSTFSSLFMGLGTVVALAIGTILMFISVELFSFALMSIVLYGYLLVQMDARKREVEAVLPDFLQLSAANARAGLPIEQALWRAATPEFGALSREVQTAMKRTFSGEAISDSLTYLSDRFNSKYLQRTVSVIKFGIESGGEIGEILERTASDLRKMQIMYKEASSSMLMYVIFITFAALIGAPFLFAVSYKLIATLSAVWMAVPPTQQFTSFGLISFSPPEISADDFRLFSILSISITSIFASFILSIIMSGTTREGIKMLPFFLIAGLGLLFIFIGIVNSLLSNLFI